MALRPQPILVTGMPRSGNTWTARLVATATGAALPGREPMNPRGQQYALAGTLAGWARLEAPSTTQRRSLRSTYAGVNPVAYSRYGRRQARAMWPTTRIVVKDPFALLSLPAVTAVTGARAVVVHRHPAACLASYRRMGWSPDLAELRHALASYGGLLARQGVDLNVNLAHDDMAGELALFWSALHAVVLDDIEQERVEEVVVVSHEQLAAGGPAGVRVLFAALGLEVSNDSIAEMRPADARDADVSGDADIHVFDRDPAAVARSWQSKVSSDDLRRVESIAGDVVQRLDKVGLDLRAG